MPKQEVAPHESKEKVKVVDLDRRELDLILEHAAESLSAEELDKLRAVVETLQFLTGELEKKRVSVQRLKKLLFGADTEKTRKVVERLLEKAGRGEGSEEDPEAGESKPKRKGHGRNGAAAYKGAKKVKVPHPSLKPGDPCPECPKGKVYHTTEPRRLIRVRGRPPLEATVYELERLRCNLCGEIFTAEAPPGIGEQTYDETSASMIALLKYGSGVPFNRLERLEGSLGIPLPASTQWGIVENVAGGLGAIYEEHIRQAAQGEVLYNDDTTMKILELLGRRSDPPATESGTEDSGRKGVFTSGVVSQAEGRRIGLFFTGRKHAGENLAEVLKRRVSELDKPIQMCDALSRNMPKELEVIVANCLVHARRNFVEVADNFPEETLHVLNVFKAVYKNEAEAKARGLPAEERLRFHQVESSPRMNELKEWMTDQIEQKKVEPNSGLGKAIEYMLKRWDTMTLFLHVPGAPLDNNICERSLKKAILHRKNAYFYKTQNGARVGDLFMTLIHTCELNDANPFDYLTELQKNKDKLASNPGAWMPWNYRETLAAAAAAR